MMISQWMSESAHQQINTVFIKQPWPHMRSLLNGNTVLANLSTGLGYWIRVDS